MRSEVISLLRSSGCSCVIRNGATLHMCHERGVKDLHRLLHNKPELLCGATLADKVVGKGAAALMIAGGVSYVYAEVLSRKAQELFEQYAVEVDYGTLVDSIINRAGTDVCPVERLCMECRTAEKCLPLIDEFVENLK